LKYEKTTEEKQEQAALYALGALSQHEAQAFEHQLSDGDSQVGEDLEAFEKVVAALGYIAESAAPPPYLLDVLTMRIQKEEQIAAPAPILQFPERSSANTQSVSGSGPNIQPQVSRTPQTVSPFPEVKPTRKSSALSFIPWALAATFAVAALVGIWSWRTARQESDALKNQIAAVQSQTEQLRNQINQENDKVFELARINQALRSPNSRVIELAGQEVAPSSTASIYWDTSGSQWVVAANLPPAPEGKVYQLWFVTAEAKISAGLLKTDNKGHGFSVVDVPKEITSIAAAAITLEPAGGSAQPTMPIYTVGKIAS
jgi:anti-sigma-K factor RskA